MNYINSWSIDQFQEHLNLYVETFKGREIVEFKIAGEGNMNYAFRISFRDNSSSSFGMAVISLDFSSTAN